MEYLGLPSCLTPAMKYPDLPSYLITAKDLDLHSYLTPAMEYFYLPRYLTSATGHPDLPSYLIPDPERRDLSSYINLAMVYLDLPTFLTLATESLELQAAWFLPWRILICPGT